MDVYHAVVAPHRKPPEELLSDIFMWCCNVATQKLQYHGILRSSRGLWDGSVQSGDGWSFRLQGYETGSLSHTRSDSSGHQAWTQNASKILSFPGSTHSSSTPSRRDGICAGCPPSPVHESHRSSPRSRLLTSRSYSKLRLPLSP